MLHVLRNSVAQGHNGHMLPYSFLNAELCLKTRNTDGFVLLKAPYFRSKNKGWEPRSITEIDSVS